MNFLGFDVRELDVERWLRGAQALYVPAALAWLALVARRRSPRWLLAGVVLANAWVFVVTCWPLQRLYGLGPSRDRVNNLGLCQVVAAGNPAWETAQPGQLHFEPFWGLLMALVSGFDPARLAALYAFMPLVTVVLFVLALEVGLRPPRGEPGAGGWQRALAAGFTTLLCAGPLDYLSGYRVTWAMMFLLKPNHALGLVLLPLVLWAFARSRTWRGYVGTGFVLHVMGWAFVIHMGLAAAGLALYALLNVVTRRAERWREVRAVAVVLGVNLLVVSPYLYLLVKGYPFLVPGAHAVIPPWSPHLLEVTWRAGALFPLAVWGGWVLWRRHGRLGRLWAAQAAGAFVMWGGTLALGELRLARELDEFYFWARLLLALTGGFGAWDLARRACETLAGRRPAWARWMLHGQTPDATRDALTAIVLAAALLPLSLPYWWSPLRMDPLFRGSLTPLPEWVAAPTAWLRAHSRPEDVVAGDHEYAAWVSALSARRVLVSSRLNTPPDYFARAALEAALVRGGDPDSVAQARARFGVRFLVVTPSWLRSFGVTLDDLQRRPDLALAHLTREPPQRFVAVFRLTPQAGEAGP